MNTVTVLVGLIGAGKTYTARQMTDCIHISFDFAWHVLTQRNDGTPEDAVRRIAEAINLLGRDVVIDGWWTWFPEWHMEENDSTLELLQELVTSAEVRVRRLVMDDDTAMQRYRHDEERPIPPDEYRASLPARNAYLQRRVEEWEKSNASSSASR